MIEIPEEAVFLFHAETRITGVVSAPLRCHPYADGSVANFDVEVFHDDHLETYECVAFKELGLRVQMTVQPGMFVTATGYMKTSPWRNDPKRLNHQLIAHDVQIVEIPKPPRVQQTEANYSDR